MSQAANISFNRVNRKFLNRRQAAEWIGIGIDKLDQLGIPRIQLGPRMYLYSIDTIHAFFR